MILGFLGIQFWCLGVRFVFLGVRFSSLGSVLVPCASSGAITRGRELSELSEPKVGRPAPNLCKGWAACAQPLGPGRGGPPKVGRHAPNLWALGLGARFQGFITSRLQGLKASSLQVFKSSRLEGFKSSSLRVSRA